MVEWLPEGMTVNSVDYCGILTCPCHHPINTVTFTSRCILSQKTGLLHPSESYQKDGNSALTSVGSMWLVSRRDIQLAACISG